MRKISDCTETELAIAKSRVFDKYISDPNLYQSQRPIGVLLGGQPGAGKSKLPYQVRTYYKDVRFVFINGDEYRQYHPRAQEIDEEYGQHAPKYTQPFSNALVEYLKAECLRLRCNFIIEGTMRSYSVIERTANEVRQAGFRCEAHPLAVSRHDSLLGVFQRFESDKQRTGIGRFSPIDVHEEAYQEIPLNLNKAYQERLVDRIAVYTRTTQNNLIVGIDWAGENPQSINFSDEFERLRVPLFDNKFYHEQWLTLRELARKRGESDETYCKQLDEFIDSFGRD